MLKEKKEEDLYLISKTIIYKLSKLLISIGL